MHYAFVYVININNKSVCLIASILHHISCIIYPSSWFIDYRLERVKTARHHRCSPVAMVTLQTACLRYYRTAMTQTYYLRYKDIRHLMHIKWISGCQIGNFELTVIHIFSWESLRMWQKNKIKNNIRSEGIPVINSTKLLYCGVLC